MRISGLSLFKGARNSTILYMHAEHSLGCHGQLAMLLFNIDKCKGFEMTALIFCVYELNCGISIVVGYLGHKGL